ncbi:phenylacetate--CoA ligase family protein [Micromonospora endolithica]|uniref:Phenylacetate--CoA ligase family protein n=1 Tax=Micromonospora endolithica TaxID=230091 RepID=A0A3A9ZHD5_9ACTN|nr:phenylacetate--CoA ligase family protein [Micromonospora endolithica]RKN47693.1 phenylacetate--CoA ligase family protein [Micromonospora endolithica]TWJ21365.1 phenylacetate-CoA ligase [Micromonospora endolithica]
MAELPHRHTVLRTVDSPLPALAARGRHAALAALGRVVAALARIIGRHPAGWRWLARRHHPVLERLAAANARAICVRAARRVPAYRAFLRAHPAGARRALADFPETDKRGYVVAHDSAARCWQGRLPTRGVVVDESAGSSGRPFNWPRSDRELRAVHRDIVGYTGLVFPMRRPFVINAYSMGAWATGTTTGAAMARIAVVKNTGPDLGKIVDTLREFGPDFDYLVTAYPPFLKHLRDRLDAEDFPWSRYRVFASCGGEGMTEALRDYLEQRFALVRSAYGASDLSIGIGAETRFTVWLRRRLQTDRELRAALLGADEQRLPMVFQYNPFATYLETNERRELVCTITDGDVLQPRLRYNVGDEALLVPYRRVVELACADPVRRAELRTVASVERMTLPVLLLFGRTDSTVSYLGANLYPQDVEYGLYDGNPYAAEIDRFCLALVEDTALETRPVIHLELRRPLAAAQRAALADACRRGVRRHLTSVSRDFAQSLVEDSSAGDLRVELHEPGTGPFAGQQKLKNTYLVR